CRDKASATRARPCGSAIPVKQLPSLVNPIPSARAWQATYSGPLRITWAPNGGGPGILTARCPPERVPDVEAVVVGGGLVTSSACRGGHPTTVASRPP